MSSASTPPPRDTSTTKVRSGPPRHTLFLPIFIFLVGAVSLSCSQVITLADQSEQLTQTADTLDARVNHASYEKTKFFKMVRDVLQLAPKDPNAEIVATRFKLHRLAEAKPELLNAGTPADVDLSSFSAPSTNSAAGSTTNAAPFKPAASH
jgi:hypothetical protein